MFCTGSKKMLNIMILKILEKYSDERRPLTQKKILELLNLEYGMKCDSRSVKANLMSLKEMDFDINLKKGIFIRRDFEESELRMLIDSVLFSKNISRSQAKRLIEIKKIPTEAEIKNFFKIIRELPKFSAECDFLSSPHQSSQSHNLHNLLYIRLCCLK